MVNFDGTNGFVSAETNRRFQSSKTIVEHWRGVFGFVWPFPYALSLLGEEGRSSGQVRDLIKIRIRSFFCDVFMDNSAAKTKSLDCLDSLASFGNRPRASRAVVVTA